MRKEVVLADDTKATGITFFHEALQPIDPRTEAILEVLEVVLDARLLSDIREDIGESYSVSATLNPQFTPESAVTSAIEASGAPESIDEIRDEIIRILADLATNGPTEIELRNASQRRRTELQPTNRGPRRDGPTDTHPRQRDRHTRPSRR